MTKAIETNAAAEEHPDDRKARQEGAEYGRKHAKQFVSQHLEEVENLIALYPDSAAEDLLERLRERFWAQEWKP